MSHRDRPAPRGPTRPAGTPPGGDPAGRRPAAGGAGPVAWDDLFDRLAPGPRARLIAAAADTGVVPADRVPSAEPTRHLLHRLLAGDGVDDLAPLDTRFTVDDLPADLDPRQRCA